MKSYIKCIVGILMSNEFQPRTSKQAFKLVFNNSNATLNKLSEAFRNDSQLKAYF